MKKYTDIVSMEEFENWLEKSRSHRVLLFKFSPICSVSFYASAQFDRFLGSLAETDDLEAVRVDVVNFRSLARAIAERLAVRHESPQVLLLHEGRCIWHESHGSITESGLKESIFG